MYSNSLGLTTLKRHTILLTNNDRKKVIIFYYEFVLPNFHYSYVVTSDIILYYKIF